MKKLCLVCMDRTGSNMLSSRLNTHPEIIFYNEIFHRQYIIFHDDRVSSAENNIFERDNYPAAFVERVWSGGFEPKEVREKTSAIGFKIFLNHNSHALRHITNADSKIIFLRRRNALSRFSSFKIAQKTGEWKKFEDSKSSLKKDKAETKKVHFYPAEFRAYYQNYMSLETLYEMTLTRWARPFFNVYYEDLISQPQVWQDIAGFLDYNLQDFGETPLKKQNTKNILERFSNPDDVRLFIEMSGHYDWLTE